MPKRAAPQRGDRLTLLPAEEIRKHAGWLWRLTSRVGLHEAVVVVVAFLIYFMIRGAVVDRAGEAMVRAFDVIAFEQQLGIYRELQMQSWIVDSYWLIKVMNWIYFWAHMPVIVVVAVWLYVTNRRTYMLTRNAFLASGAIGVVIYAMFPVAPPRLIPMGGFVDTMAVFDRVGYQAQEVKAFVNPFAAIPSLHFGWSLLMGLVIFKVAKFRVVKALGLVWPVAMFFAVVMTGNHFIIDAVAGAVVSLAGLGIAFGIQRYGPVLVEVARTRVRGEAAREPAA